MSPPIGYWERDTYLLIPCACNEACLLFLLRQEKKAVGLPGREKRKERKASPWRWRVDGKGGSSPMWRKKFPLGRIS